MKWLSRPALMEMHQVALRNHLKCLVGRSNDGAIANVEWRCGARAWQGMEAMSKSANVSQDRLREWLQCYICASCNFQS